MAKADNDTDVQLHRRVLEELAWDTRVDETDVGVEVDNRVVTLTGHVDSYAKRKAAEQAAHRVPGVRDVANDIQVHIPGSVGKTDTEIAQAVRRALQDDVYVPDEDIETTVSNGWVTLVGDVDHYREREDAERAIVRLRGVRGITNMLTVHAKEIPPYAIREAIEQALDRRAAREAERIKVHVDNGVVTLTGEVHTWPDRRAVVGAAAHAPGVRSVVDHLTYAA
jgi:osmotically-inducible protein OsmY